MWMFKTQLQTKLNLTCSRKNKNRVRLQLSEITFFNDVKPKKSGKQGTTLKVRNNHETLHVINFLGGMNNPENIEQLGQIGHNQDI